MIDPAHTWKNGTLQVMSMARVLTMGIYVLLNMHLVAVQCLHKEAGLFAEDVNGSDRMDLKAAARRSNLSVRRALPKCLERSRPWFTSGQ